jgi:hypothetical protein
MGLEAGRSRKSSEKKQRTHYNINCEYIEGCVKRDVERGSR